MMFASAWKSSCALAAGLAAVPVLTAGCSPGQAEENPGPQMAEVERRNLEITAEASGELEPVREVEVKSRASGELVEVAVEVGDRVEPGTLMTRVDPRDVQNALAEAEAEYQVAQERYAIARAELDRADSLLAANVITEQNHENNRLNYANARSNRVRAETSLELAELRMEDVTIRAPIHGVVLSRQVEEGTVIQGAGQSMADGTTLMTVADLDLMRVRTLVDETDIGRIHAGMPVTVHVDAFSDDVFEGEVERVEPGPTVESSVVMYPVIVHLENEDGRLKPGMSAEVTIQTDMAHDALTLPNNTIVSFDEMAVAGNVLGVPDERMSFDRSVFRELRREVAGEPGEEMPQAAEGDREGLDMAELRERVQSGEISREEIRERMQEAGMGPGGRGGPGRGDRGGALGEPGVVFVEAGDGRLEARPVLIGVNDWTNSQILAGLEEGERVAIIGGAQLRAQQEQRIQGMRSRMRGSLPF